MRWAIANLINDIDFLKIRNVCKELSLPFVSCEVIPFSKEVPNHLNDGVPTMFYGSVNWINQIYESKLWSKYLCIDPDLTYLKWSEKYGEECLNYGKTNSVLKLGDFAKKKYDADKLFFIRPISDNKEFAGQVKEFGEIKKWVTNQKDIQTEDIDLNELEVLVGEPYKLKSEWRFFVVNGEIVGGSRYREGQKLSLSEAIPEVVVKYAYQMIEKYSPLDMFVIDICHCGDRLYVLEVGSFHSAGFYACDLKSIIFNVNKFYDQRSSS